MVSGPSVLVHWFRVLFGWSVVFGPLVRGSLVLSGLLFTVGVEVLKGGGIFSVFFVYFFVFFLLGAFEGKEGRKQGMPGERKEGRKEGAKRKQERKKER